MRDRRGFILLFGARKVVSDDRVGGVVAANCPKCGQPRLEGKSVRTYFTLFFLPVFPMSAVQRFTRCGNCGAAFAMPAGQFDSAAAVADNKTLQRGIAMYNSLRASPSNSITLNELMQLYCSIGEYAQAASAANDFPLALSSSEQCMTTLGRVYLEMNQPDVAVEWLDRSLQRRADQGDAQYAKALAHLKQDPPRLAEAAAAAKAARKADFPNARELADDIDRRLYPADGP